MKGKDLISVIVPVYNVEKYIHRCIDSIIEQTYENTEIILVDDGSPDNCPKICDEYEKKDKRIKVIHKKNGGLSDARNVGIEASKGKFICFIDSDDYIEKNYIKKMYESIIKNNSDIAICNYNRVYYDKTMPCEVNEFNTINFITPAAWNKLYKKDLFKNIKYPVGMYYEDLGTIPKLLMSGIKYCFVEDYLYNYIQNTNSIMHKSNDKIFDIYKVLENNISYAKKNKNYDKYKRNIELAYVFHVLIGTSYRASSHEKFNYNMVKEIYNNTKNTFPFWYKNKGIKKLNILYKIFLIQYKYKLFLPVYLELKLFGKYINKYR